MINPNTRVNQLDASLLDQELFQNLSKQTLSIFSHGDLSYFKNYSNEITLLLNSIIFKLTIWDKNQSYGLFLQNLKYDHTFNRSKKATYYLLFILGHYISQNVSSYVYNDDDEDEQTQGPPAHTQLKQIFKKLYVRGDKLYKLLSFVNFLDFLVTGKYQSLKLRLLNIKIQIFSIELAKLNKGNISFEFQNRQLIWNTFLEFILFILPIFQNSKFQSIIYNLLNPSKKSPALNIERFKHLREKQCAICFENDINSSHDFNITNPYQTDCNHLYCYVCLVSKLQIAKDLDKPWNCHKCGSVVHNCKPFDDVDTDSIVFKIGDDGDTDDQNEKRDYEDERDLHDEPEHETSEDEYNETSEVEQIDEYSDDDDEYEDNDNDDEDEVYESYEDEGDGDEEFEDDAFD